MLDHNPPEASIPTRTPEPSENPETRTHTYMCMLPRRTQSRALNPERFRQMLLRENPHRFTTASPEVAQPFQVGIRLTGVKALPKFGSQASQRGVH